ncbi:MAG: uroporphyrinogen-III synthase [Gammaproteobacteria bacterium]|jgi:uroporphyrinogen-III synthase|nr:uroporphyrinogen-III synthase [Gammaproteobacteria bacterium]
MVKAIESLRGKVVAVPENRQLILLSNMLRKRGADVIAVPMIAILDAPDSEPILSWIKDFIRMPPDILILLTGEGLRRLIKLAEKNGLKADFIKVLSKVNKLCRGPKPNQALREIGLERELDAQSPTTDGVITSLNELELSGKNIAVQLYGEEPNVKLISYLEQAGAHVKSVAPYVYANNLDDKKIIDLINKMHIGDVDVIAFSSQPQVNRLFKVAKKYQLEAELKSGLGLCYVAAIGPLVKEVLNKRGVNVEIMPQRTFFMKPLVTAIAKFLSKQEQLGL